MALTDKLTAIADAIRLKTGGTAKLTLDEMATTIGGIETGGSEIETRTIVFDDTVEDLGFIIGTQYVDGQFKTFAILPSGTNTLPTLSTYPMTNDIDIQYYHFEDDNSDGYYMYIDDIVCGSLLIALDSWGMGWGSTNDSKWNSCIANYEEQVMCFRVPTLNEQSSTLYY